MISRLRNYDGTALHSRRDHGSRTGEDLLAACIGIQIQGHRRIRRKAVCQNDLGRRINRYGTCSVQRQRGIGTCPINRHLVSPGARQAAVLNLKNTLIVQENILTVISPRVSAHADVLEHQFPELSTVR